MSLDDSNAAPSHRRVPIAADIEELEMIGRHQQQLHHRLDANNAPRLPIESLEDYIKSHGLTDQVSDSLSENNLHEAQQRVSDEQRYQASVHKTIFSNLPKHDDEIIMDKLQFLESLGNETMEIETRETTIRNVSLKLMARHCDTIYALASTRQHFAEGQDSSLVFSLSEFGHDSVQEFLLLLKHEQLEDVVRNEFVVDCCKIAHYVQCTAVFDAMANILLDAVNDDNCLSLCELADRFNMPVLFETSLSKMMKNLTFDEALWDQFSPTLKNHVESIKLAIQSSVHLQRNQLYFSSLKEYIAIFAENVEYHRERLAEAKVGLLSSKSHKSYEYTTDKITKQEERVKCLEAALKEQKKIFLTNKHGDTPIMLNARKGNQG